MAWRFVVAGAGPVVDGFWLGLFVLIELVRLGADDTWSALDDAHHRASECAPGQHWPVPLLNHPNYWVVIGEIAVLPLVFGLWRVAFVFTL